MTNNSFQQISRRLETEGGYITRQAWGGNTRVYRFSPVENAVETTRVDGSIIPLRPFLIKRVGEGIAEVYVPTQEDLDANDWQLFTRRYVLS